MDRLLGIARKAISTHGKSSRAVVRKAVREAGLTIAEDRLTDLMNHLRTESNPSLDQGRIT